MLNNDDGQLSVGSVMEEAKSWFGNIDNNVANVDILDLDINLIVNIDKKVLMLKEKMTKRLQLCRPQLHNHNECRMSVH